MDRMPSLVELYNEVSVVHEGVRARLIIEASDGRRRKSSTFKFYNRNFSRSSGKVGPRGVCGGGDGVGSGRSCSKCVSVVLFCSVLEFGPVPKVSLQHNDFRPTRALDQARCGQAVPAPHKFAALALGNCPAYSRDHLPPPETRARGRADARACVHKTHTTMADDISSERSAEDRWRCGSSSVERASRGPSFVPLTIHAGASSASPEGSRGRRLGR